MFNLRGFDMNLLTVFEAIYEARNVGVAAQRLALSQAATSHALGRLRQVCGDELFVRAGQQFVPTPSAKAFFPKVQEALRVLRQGLAETRGFDPATSERHFNVAIPHPLGPVIAHSIRVAMAAAVPRVTLNIDTRTMLPDLSQELRAGDYDLAIDWLRVEQDQFINKRIHDEVLMLIMRRGHPRLGAKPTLEDLRQEEFVWLHPRRPTEHRPKTVQLIEDLGLKVVLSVSEWLEVPTLVASFDLLSIVPQSLSPILTRQMQLRVVPFPVKLPPVPIYETWHESRRNDAGHRWLRDLVAAKLRGLAAGGFGVPPA